MGIYHSKVKKQTIILRRKVQMEARKISRIALALFIFLQCLIPVNADTDIRYLNCAADPRITSIIGKIEKSIIKENFF